MSPASATSIKGIEEVAGGRRASASQSQSQSQSHAFDSIRQHWSLLAIRKNHDHHTAQCEAGRAAALT